MEELRGLVEKRGREGMFVVGKIERVGLYEEVENCRRDIAEERIGKLKRIQERYRQMNKRETKMVFVTFNHSYAKINLMRLNSRSFFQKLFSRSSSSLPFSILSTP